MKQSMTAMDLNKEYREQTAAVYVRLSRDDNLEGESYSIQNQKKMLLKAVKEKGYSQHKIYSDDGISGVTMNRPGFKQMISDIESGFISAIFVKDMSRLGRNYLQVGHYTEEFFPEHDVRLIAVSDGVDTFDGMDEFTPFRNIMNEWYARDISKKCKAVNQMKGRAGEPLSMPPYGYMKDPTNPKRWVIDREPARVVKRIFDMYLDGQGVAQIAKALHEDGVLTPMHYWQSIGKGRGGLISENETEWNKSSVRKILYLQEYCGDVINFKTYSKSFKQKKRLRNSEENMAIFHDVHDPIIDRVIYERAQKKLGDVRHKVARDSAAKNMFSGLLVCADCGGKLHFHFSQTNNSIEYFSCSNYNKTHKSCFKTHYIRVDFLEEVLLQEIHRLTQYVRRYERQFAEVAMGHSKQESELDQKLTKKELDKCLGRDKELDKLSQLIYEDNALGKITDERFMKLQKQYDMEQAEVSKKIKALRAKLETETNSYMTVDMFINEVRKYTKAKKLNERMLNKLIDRIEVHHAEIVDGEKTQRLIIHYNCIGTVEIPEVLPLAAPDVTINTRQGVWVSYAS